MFDLRVDGRDMIFTERKFSLSAILVKNGEWYEGELQKNGARHGYIRLKRTTEGVRVQFKETNEEAWDTIQHFDARNKVARIGFGAIFGPESNDLHGCFTQ